MKQLATAFVFTLMLIAVVIAGAVEFIAWSVQRVFAAVGLG